MQQPEHKPISDQEYRELEAKNPDIKYELIDGIPYAMSGGSKAHARIAFNIGLQMEQGLGNSPCMYYNSDVKVRIEQETNNNKKGTYLYPDGVVTCDRIDIANSEEYIVSPHVVFEVLSRSTEGKDRGVKLNKYKAHNAIQEIVFLKQDTFYIEVHTRDQVNSSTWSVTVYENEQDKIILHSLDLSLVMKDIYNRVRF